MKEFIKRLRSPSAKYSLLSHPGGYWEDQGYNWFGGS